MEFFFIRDLAGVLLVELCRGCSLLFFLSFKAILNADLARLCHDEE